MTLKVSIRVLERHNRWRRGEEIEPESPTAIGIAIDTVLAALRRREHRAKTKKGVRHE